MGMTPEFYPGEESDHDRFMRLLEGSLENIAVVIALEVGPDIAEQIMRKAIRIAMKNFDRLEKDDQFYFWLRRIVARVRKRMLEKTNPGSPSNRKRLPK